jgi:hypothetical protein
MDIWEHCGHHLLGGHHVRDSCRDFIGRCAPYWPVIILLQIPRLTVGHDITKADSRLALKNSE